MSTSSVYKENSRTAFVLFMSLLWFISFGDGSIFRASIIRALRDRLRQLTELINVNELVLVSWWCFLYFCFPPSIKLILFSMKGYTTGITDVARVTTRATAVMTNNNVNSIAE